MIKLKTEEAKQWRDQVKEAVAKAHLHFLVEPEDNTDECVPWINEMSPILGGLWELLNPVHTGTRTFVEEV